MAVHHRTTLPPVRSNICTIHAVHYNYYVDPGYIIFATIGSAVIVVAVSYLPTIKRAHFKRPSIPWLLASLSRRRVYFCTNFVESLRPANRVYNSKSCHVFAISSRNL